MKEKNNLFLSYQEMVTDEQEEKQAYEWIEGLIQDMRLADLD
jgi:hypothetical protein